MFKLVFVMMLVFSFAFPASGTLHLIYSNGTTLSEDAKTYYVFDVQIWLSEGEEILSSGMVYVDYPTDIFGEMLVYNDKVLVQKTGILQSVLPDVITEVYDVITNDNRNNCFAVTFDAFFAGSADMQDFYGKVSTDPQAPSELFRIRMEVAASGSGQLLFPSYLPGTESLYWNFNYETFDGGLDYSEAVEDVIVPADIPVGSLNLFSFTAAPKKSDIIIKWSTRYETDIVGYNLLHSTDGFNFAMLTGYATNPSLLAQEKNSVNKYEVWDAGAASAYSVYRLEAVDIAGNTLSLAQVEVGNGISYTVLNAHPNPFNPGFTVPFVLQENMDVTIRLFDMSGKMVRDIANGNYAPGSYAIRVLCDDLSSGMYVLTSNIAGEHHSQKMLLVK
ncbi:MAG: T9SS type A sorting domain-containing protein [Candidatus Neomarinimicrobiota bacterium]|jgi:hypothetical protein|nr:T9SS type A sorting domain-containing protein [Candidatus Neomarinimicrobiota bacterium]MDX9781016.1 T9SS type A sorting domain-containing protein [bacterium]